MDAPGIFTIGYGSRSISQFIDTLQIRGIRYRIDVRSKPYSRFKPEFSRDALTTALRLENIRYVFMGDLLGGQPSDSSCYTEGKADYGKIESKPFYAKGIARLIDAYEKGYYVALMCSEGKPQDCHRSKLIGETLSKKSNIPLFHIDENGALKSQQAVISLLNEGQLSMFMENTFTSRKTYDAASK
jgi:uncharacterized protein (DUF488 family)